MRGAIRLLTIHIKQTPISSFAIETLEPREAYNTAIEVKPASDEAMSGDYGVAKGAQGDADTATLCVIPFHTQYSQNRSVTKGSLRARMPFDKNEIAIYWSDILAFHGCDLRGSAYDITNNDIQCYE